MYPETTNDLHFFDTSVRESAVMVLFTCTTLGGNEPPVTYPPRFSFIHKSLILIIACLFPTKAHCQILEAVACRNIDTMF